MISQVLIWIKIQSTNLPRMAEITNKTRATLVCIASSTGNLSVQNDWAWDKRRRNCSDMLRKPTSTKTEEGHCPTSDFTFLPDFRLHTFIFSDFRLHFFFRFPTYFLFFSDFWLHLFLPISDFTFFATFFLLLFIRDRMKNYRTSKLQSNQSPEAGQ